MSLDQKQLQLPGPHHDHAAVLATVGGGLPLWEMLSSEPQTIKLPNNQGTVEISSKAALRLVCKTLHNTSFSLITALGGVQLGGSRFNYSMYGEAKARKVTSALSKMTCLQSLEIEVLAGGLPQLMDLMAQGGLAKTLTKLTITAR